MFTKIQIFTTLIAEESNLGSLIWVRIMIAWKANNFSSTAATKNLKPKAWVYKTFLANQLTQKSNLEQPQTSRFWERNVWNLIMAPSTAKSNFCNKNWRKLRNSKTFKINLKKFKIKYLIKLILIFWNRG